MKRRGFIKSAGVVSLGIPFLNSCSSVAGYGQEEFIESGPVSINTWNFQKAGKVAGDTLAKGGAALDAVQQGVMVEEANLENTTVGNGGSPDRDGNVTLDACIMAPNGNCGSVAYLKEIEHPVAVARKVMEETPHVMLVGEGAYNFAIQQGFKSKNLLTENSEKEWKKWLKEKDYRPIINIENHDTIGMLAIDQTGDIAGACTTSGLAYKMQGRVGDSPIIGSGLFVDNEVGGAVATGMGEEILKNVSSFLVVELMRQGNSPQKSCEMAIKRIIKNNSKYEDFQVALLAINKKGEVGSYCIHPGFTYVVNRAGENKNIKSKSYL